MVKEENILFFDDFKEFPLGPFPYDKEHSAMGEYHYFKEEGYKGDWYDPITNWSYKGPSWLCTSPFMNGERVMEQMRIIDLEKGNAASVLKSGNEEWTDYTVESEIRVFKPNEIAGILFHYQTSMMHYGLFLTENAIEFQLINKLERKTLKRAIINWCEDEFITLKVSISENEYKCFANEKEIFTVVDDTYKKGKVALCACTPAQYKYIKVTGTFKEEEKKVKSSYPQPKLIKKIDLKDFGAGRQIRFGRLTGTDELFFIICQHQRRVFKDRYPFISCMTAVSLESGKILWQKGEPRDSEEVIELTTDLPFQIYDIDNDGIDEVICSWDFKLFILDGRDGSVKKSIPTPLNDDNPEDVCALEFGKFAFNRLNIDAIRIVNVSGNERPSDILIKDRYSRLWVLDSNLNLLWRFNYKNSGHFPFSYDINKDGKDEIFCGYNLIDSKGNLIWTLPIETDHTDEIIIGKFNPDEEEQIAIVSGWEGFIIANKDGELKNQDINGHGQRISIANYIPEKKGLEICTTTYWGNNCIIYMHDCEGNEIWHKEMDCNGNVITPVSWDGSDSELILLNGDFKDGGLMDGKGNVVVLFPEDGHPVLCAEVIDIDDDGLDEVILWDRKNLYVYEQDNKNPIPKSDRAEKYPHYNGSNYRGEYALRKNLK